VTAARRRRLRTRLILPLLGAAVFFALGIAVGEAVHDNPEPGGTQTIVRTLNPLGLPPAPATTVTVTTGKR
jgi:hypothetical protein